MFKMPMNKPPLQASSLQPPRNSPLTRSKSLRLPLNKPTEEALPQLTRQGSVRLPKPPLKKPLIKPKPQILKNTNDLPLPPPPTVNKSSIMRSSSTSNVHTAWKEPKVPPVKFRTLQRNGGGMRDNYYHDPHMTNSLYSNASRMIPSDQKELMEHLKRLTEEHEKLQMKYARFRLQVLENNSQCISSISSSSNNAIDSGISDTNSSSGDSEDSVDSNPKIETMRTKILQLEALNQDYHKEILASQEETRQIQKQYWEMVLHQKAFEGSQPSAPQQVIDLVDRLEEKIKELQVATTKNRELESSLNSLEQSHSQCQSVIFQNDQTIANLELTNEKLNIELHNSQSEFRESLETLEFMKSEREALTEGLQDTENRLLLTQTELENQKSAFDKLMDNSNRLYTKVQEKNEKIQKLQIKLDQSQSEAQDVLVSQGAERTMAVLALSQISDRIHSILGTMITFALQEMKVNPEILEEVISEDRDKDKNNDENEFTGSPIKGFSIFQNQITQKEVYDELKQLDSNNKAKSLVQTMIEAIEYSKPPSTPPKNEQLNPDAYQPQSAFKPVGVTTPFKPCAKSLSAPEGHISKHNEATRNDFNKNKSSLEVQASVVSSLFNKISSMLSFLYSKFLNLEYLEKENDNLQTSLEKLTKQFASVKIEVSAKDAKIEAYAAKTKEKSQTKEFLMKQNEGLAQELEHLREVMSSLQAVNEEQSRQMREDVKKLVDEAVHNSGYLLNIDHLGVLDKLALKQENTRLQEAIKFKENQLQQLSMKFLRNRKTLEENWSKAEKEVQRIDYDLTLAFETLKSVPGVLATCPALKSLFLKFGGDPTILEPYSTPRSSSKTIKIVTTV